MPSASAAMLFRQRFAVMRARTAFSILSISVCCLAFTAFSAAAPAGGATSVKQHYDIPSGDARTMLRRFAREAKREIMFAVDNVTGVKTSAVKGEFTVQEALAQMLAGTGLAASVDAKTGAIAVQRKTAPGASNSPSADKSLKSGAEQTGRAPSGSFPNSEEHHPDRNPKNMNPRTPTAWLASLLATILHAQSATPSSPELGRSADETVLLSAFEVRSRKDAGYRTANASATTGIATAIAKIPLSITTVTDGFLKDTGLENYIGALRYVSSVSFDTTAPNGSYSISEFTQRANPNTGKFRGQPYSGTFRNGLPAAFTATTDNIDRIEVAKGPMAVFVGGALLGGEANYVTRKPLFTKRTELLYQYGSYNRSKFGLDATGPLRKDLAYRLIATFASGDTYRDFSHSEQSLINPQVLWHPTKQLVSRTEWQSTNDHGNAVSYNTRSSENYRNDAVNPPQELLNLGKLRTTGPGAGVPFTVGEYRARIGTNFSQWSRDRYDAFGKFGVLGDGENGIIEWNTPNGRRYNVFGPDAPYFVKADVGENETTFRITDALELRNLFNITSVRTQYDNAWLAQRAHANGATNMVQNQSVRFKQQVLVNRAELAFGQKLSRLSVRLLGGFQYRSSETTSAFGIWDLSKLPSLPGSPNVYATPATLSGNDIFTYYDLNFHPIPSYRSAIRYADDFTPIGQRSRSYSKNWNRAWYSSGNIGIWNDRVVVTGGFRRTSVASLSQGRDRVDTVLTSAGVPYVSTNSYMVGLAVEVAKNVNLYASRNQGETAASGGSLVSRFTFGLAPQDIVSVQERAANPLPNASGVGKEVGMKVELADGKVTGSVAWFNLTRGGITVQDNDRMSKDPRNVGTEIDANPATRNPNFSPWVQWLQTVEGNATEGFESDWIITPTRNFSLILSGMQLTKNKQTVIRPNSTNPDVLKNYLVLNGRPLDAAPNNIVSAFMRYEASEGRLKGASIGIGARRVSRALINGENAAWGIVSPTHISGQLNLGYKTKVLERDTVLNLLIDNVTNTSYFEGNSTFAPPRNYSLSVRTSF